MNCVLNFQGMLCGVVALFAAASVSGAASATGQVIEAKPEKAEIAILKAFETYEVVGISAAHRQKDLDELLLSVIRNPAFPDTVNDIVVECGNSLYQPLLDRYISGENVTLDEVRRVWRDSTQFPFIVSSFYGELFPLVRRINLKLPANKRIRILAGDPPIDWQKVSTFADFNPFVTGRDANIASVVEREVFAKKRKALMLFGIGHLLHGPDGRSAVATYERNYPGKTYVIAAYPDVSCTLPSRDDGHDLSGELETRMASWPVSSIVSAKDTSIGALLAAIESRPTVDYRKVDALLYLGPRDLALAEAPDLSVFQDKEFMAELRRRAGILTAYSPAFYPADIEKTLTGTGDTFLCPCGCDPAGGP